MMDARSSEAGDISFIISRLRSTKSLCREVYVVGPAYLNHQIAAPKACVCKLRVDIRKQLADIAL
jgi:hypothetical protein